MKISTKLLSPILALLTVLLYSNCAKKSSRFVQEQSDGFLFTANEESFKNVRDNSSYVITFVDVGGQKTVDRDGVKAALGNPAKFCTMQGTASRVGTNQLKLTTGSKLTVDLNRPFATFWGIDSKKLRDILTGGAAGESCGTCGGIPDMVQVTCTDPASVLCCMTCK